MRTAAAACPEARKAGILGSGSVCCPTARLKAMPLMLAVRHSHPALAALETQVPELAAASRSGAERALMKM